MRAAPTPRSPSARAPASILLAGLVASTMLAGCSDPPGVQSSADAGDTSTTSTASTTSTSVDVTSSTPTQGTSAAPSLATQTLFDVNGHQMYMSCKGTGSPTVVHIHGWVNDPGFTPHLYELQVQQLLSDDFRVCLYDRRNVGSSEVVDAVQTPDDMLRDLETLLRVAGTEPPYVLMAGSFGGLLGYSYLSHHPENVVGMVMLDAMFPDELALDRYLPEEFTFLHYRPEDLCCTLERISEYDLITSLQKYIGHEPDVPLVYVASLREPPHQEGYESPEFDARLLSSLKGFIKRFSPGRLTWVDAPHFMEPHASLQIEEAVRKVVRLAS